MLFALTAQLGVQAANWYVDKTAAGVNNGSSWANAWSSFGAISWSSIRPGDNLFISGGPTGSSKTYTETLTIGASGTSAARIRIGLDASNSSHNGTVVLDNNYIDVSSQSYVTISGNCQRAAWDAAQQLLQHHDRHLGQQSLCRQFHRNHGGGPHVQ